MRKNQIVLALSVALLVLSMLACNLAGLIPTPTPTPLPAPTPTTTLPPPTPAPLTEPSDSLEAQIEAVYSQVAPAVVHIASRVITYDYFMQPIPQEGTGSGFLFDTKGHIVTNYHVVENAEEVSVTLADGGVYLAEVVGEDPSNDLAVIRIEATALPEPIPVGDSDQLRVGQFVVAIGNPFGLDQTLTVGVISALGRVIHSPDQRFIGEAIQTDAAINPGNSGGPLLDLRGRVIGVNSQIISPVQGSAGIGFAVSSNSVQRVVPQLIAHGRYPHPWLGVQIFDLTPERAQVFREAGMEVPVEEGMMVVEVVPGSPAAAAGIRRGDQMVQLGNAQIPLGGDIITEVNGIPVANSQKLSVYLESEMQVGDEIEVTLIRGGREMTVKVTLAERPAQP